MKSECIHSVGNKIYTISRGSTQVMGVYDGHKYVSDNTIRSRSAKSSKTT